MPKPKSPEPRVRLNLEIPERVRDRLERLRLATDAESMTEVIRRSLAVYEVLVFAAQDGARITVTDAEGERSLLLVEG